MLTTINELYPVVRKFLSSILDKTGVSYDGILVISSDTWRDCSVHVKDRVITKLTWGHTTITAPNGNWFSPYGNPGEDKFCVKVMSITDTSPWVFITPAEYLSRHDDPYIGDLSDHGMFTGNRQLPGSDKYKYEEVVVDWFNREGDLGDNPIIVGWPLSAQIKLNRGVIRYTRDLQDNNRVLISSDVKFVEDYTVAKDGHAFGWDVTYNEPYASVYTCSNLIRLIREYMRCKEMDEFRYKYLPGVFIVVTEESYSLPGGFHASPKDIRVVYDLVHSNTPVTNQSALDRILGRLRKVSKYDLSIVEPLFRKPEYSVVITGVNERYDVIVYTFDKNRWSPPTLKITKSDYVVNNESIVIETLKIREVLIDGKISITI